MAQDEMLLFRGRNRIRYGYARWGYTRGGGKTWHGGADVEGLDDTTIRMPGYGLGAGRHAISGTVVTARRVAQSTGNPTWEWGWYVCVKLDANQTPDAVNYLYFCHNAKNLAAVGQRVKTGDALAVMGNTGNAALASPPYAHCHFEVRATATGRGLNPAQYMGFENAVGTFGTAPQRFAPFSSGECLVCARGSGPLSAGDIQLLKAWAESKPNGKPGWSVRRYLLERLLRYTILRLSAWAVVGLTWICQSTGQRRSALKLSRNR